MTNRERIENSFLFKKTDRLCYAPLCDNYFAEGLEKQGHKKDLFEAFKYIGCDIILRHAPSYIEKHEGFIVETLQQGDKYQTVYTTPKGKISNLFYYKTGTMYLEKHLVETINDVEVMEYVAQNTYYEPVFDKFSETDNLIGDYGIATATAPCSPIMDMLQIYCGLENTTYLFADEKETVDALLNALHERNKRVYQLLTKLPSDYIFTYEDTSTTVLNMDWMENYAVPALNEYAEIMHRASKKYITHMCGKLYGFRNQIAGVKSDGIDSVCPPTTGDMPLKTAKECFPGKVLIGGIGPPSMVLKSRAELLSGIIGTLNEMPDKRGVILSSGDAVPYGTDINTLKAISLMIKDLGVKSLEQGIDKNIINNYI